MPYDPREKWLGLLSFGFFIMLFALFFIIVPDYYAKVTAFFNDFKLQEVASNVQIPAPVHHHPVIYETVMRFCIVFGLLHFFILGLRLYFKSSISKIAETISNAVFWLGAAYMFSLILSRNITWFPLIGGIITVFGLSIITRSVTSLLMHLALNR
jgi:hypothetical protein